MGGSSQHEGFLNLWLYEPYCPFEKANEDVERHGKTTRGILFQTAFPMVVFHMEKQRFIPSASPALPRGHLFWRCGTQKSRGYKMGCSRIQWLSIKLPMLNQQWRIETTPFEWDPMVFCLDRSSSPAQPCPACPVVPYPCRILDVVSPIINNDPLEIVHTTHLWWFLGCLCIVAYSWGLSLFTNWNTLR